VLWKVKLEEMVFDKVLGRVVLISLEMILLSIRI
jgi:hypothetical protein